MSDTKRQQAVRKAAATCSANAEARRAATDAEARRSEKEEEEDTTKQETLAPARKAEHKGRRHRRRSADGSNDGARLMKPRRERVKAKPQSAAAASGSSDEEDDEKETEVLERRTHSHHNQVIVAGTRSMKSGGTKDEMTLAMGCALLRRPRRSSSPRPDSRRNRSASPARRSTVAALTQQLEETKAELQRARDELKGAVRHERIDALKCHGCNEHMRCSQCHECIPCCLEGETCELSKVPAHQRRLPRRFHATYFKPPLSRSTSPSPD